MQLDCGQQEPVNVWQLGHFVVIFMRSKKGKRTYQRYLTQEQFELLLEKLLKVQKIRISRGYNKQGEKHG